MNSSNSRSKILIQSDHSSNQHSGQSELVSTMFIIKLNIYLYKNRFKQTKQKKSFEKKNFKRKKY